MRFLTAAIAGVMTNMWSRVLGAALLICLPCVAGAQSSGDDVRKRHITCAAVLGVAGTISADKKVQERLSGASLLLLTWAADVVTNQPAKARTDEATREFVSQVTEIGRTIKPGTPAATKAFEEKYGGAQKACEAWFVAETKKRKSQ
jgi:hypothetical protein